MRAVTHILQSKDDRAKAIRDILDLFLPKFSNLSKDTPIIIDLEEGLSPGVVGTGVSILTDLYFDIEIIREIHISENGFISKGIQRYFKEFLNNKDFRVSELRRKLIIKYNMELEQLNEFNKLTPKLFMSCVILDINKRSGILDFDLLNKAEKYYEHCMRIVELFLQKIDVNNSVISNPVFGCIDHAISGDGDFILNGCLYDIKTTKSIEVDKNSRRQLLFYYLMNHRDSVSFSNKVDGVKFDISKLYVYKARHGISIEIPINLRGTNPLDIIKIITEVEIGKISPSEGVLTVTSMLKEELNPKKYKNKPERKERKTTTPKRKAHVFKVKKVFMCNETKEVFNSVREANSEHGYSKNAIYRQLENGGYTTTRGGNKYTWRILYKIV